MEESIVNRVDKSGIITLNLEDLKTPGDRVEIDIKDSLYQGMVLREKDFREFVKEHDWEQYSGKHVAIHCSADAIVPVWAYMLIASKLSGIAGTIVYGSLDVLNEELYKDEVSKFPFDDYKDQRIVIKGCSDGVPPSIYIKMTEGLKGRVKSIMYGEACSSVPIYKSNWQANR